MAEIVNNKKNIPNDLLTDLSSRFIINVPEEERVDLIRLCFQIELAHWFYLDFYCEENPKLPKCTVKDFIKIIFGHIPFLKKYIPQVDTVIAEWKEYKSAVPTCGAILLDEELKNVLLVQSFYSRASWSFPKGKINIDELPHTCAIREVFEETGFDISDLINENEFLEHNFNGQLIRLYIITGVPLSTKFQPKTKNEIKNAEWFILNQLPYGKTDQVLNNNLGANNFFMVGPFMKQLKKWITSRKLNSNKKGQEKNVIEKYSSKQPSSKVKVKEEQKHCSSPKAMYSPPPRILRQKSQKLERKRNLFPLKNEENSSSSDLSHNILSENPYAKEVFSNNINETKYALCPMSLSWKNFSLDTEALIATFSINLRNMWPSRLLSQE